jgi:hypothetical protein
MPSLQDSGELAARRHPAFKLEAALKCRSCKKGRCSPPVHMIKLTMQREIAFYAYQGMIKQ